MKKNMRLGLASMAILIAGSVCADELHWTNSAGGVFGGAANWSPNGTPGVESLVYFDWGISGNTVTLSSNATVSSFIVMSTVNVAFDLAGYTLTTTNTTTDKRFSIGQMTLPSGTQTAFFTSSVPGGVINAAVVAIGGSTWGAQTTYATFSGSNLTLHAGTGSDHSFLRGSSGILKFEKGVQVITDKSLFFGSSGAANGASRSVIFTDPGTKLTLNDWVYGLGGNGTGLPTVYFTNGATATQAAAKGWRIAMMDSYVDTNSNGRLVVTGSGSAVYMGGNLDMSVVAGNDTKTGGAFVEVLDGGKITVTGMVAMAKGFIGTSTNANSYGKITLSNNNSVLEIRGSGMTVGTSGYGDVIVADHAKLISTNTASNYIHLAKRSTLTVSDASVEAYHLNVYDSVIRIELGDRAYDNAYIKLRGNLNVYDTNATLQIGVLGSFVDPSYLEEITLFSFANHTASFEFKGLTDMTEFTADGHDFRILYYDDKITLQAIPEPGTLGLLAASLGLAAVIRRRRMA